MSASPNPTALWRRFLNSVLYHKLAAPLPRPVLIGLGGLATALPFLWHLAANLSTFYDRGRHIMDAGFIAAMIWHNDWLASIPMSIMPGSFYRTHFVPAFPILSGLSYLVPVSMPVWFALFMAVSYSLITAGSYYLLTSVYRLRSLGGALLAAGLSVVLAFNGLTMATIAYPHYEHAIPIFGFLFLIFAFQGRHLPAAIFMALSLSFREDAGFHLTAVLALFILVNRLRGIKFRQQRSWLIYTAAAFGYSIFCLAVVKQFFPGDEALKRVYLGDPILAHLTPELIRARLSLFFTERVYVWLPGLVTIVWAIVRRNPYLPLGFLAYIPWLVLHLAAVTPAAGDLWAYYSFPLMMSVFWPLALVTAPPDRDDSPRERRINLIWLTVLILASTITLGHTLRVGFGYERLDPGRWIRTARAVTAIEQDRAALEPMAVDPEFLSLVAKTTPPHAWNKRNLPDYDFQSAAMFAWGAYNRPLVKKVVALGLKNSYRLKNGSVVMFSNRRLTDLPHLGPMLEPAGYFLELCWPRNFTAHIARQPGDAPGKAGVITRLDRLNLPVGRIRYSLGLRLSDVADQTKPVIGLRLRFNAPQGESHAFRADQLVKRDGLWWAEFDRWTGSVDSKRGYILEILGYGNAELDLAQLRLVRVGQKQN